MVGVWARDIMGWKESSNPSIQRGRSSHGSTVLRILTHLRTLLDDRVFLQRRGESDLRLQLLRRKFHIVCIGGLSQSPLPMLTAIRIPKHRKDTRTPAHRLVAVADLAMVIPCLLRSFITLRPQALPLPNVVMQSILLNPPLSRLSRASEIFRRFKPVRMPTSELVRAISHLPLLLLQGWVIPTLVDQARCRLRRVAWCQVQLRS